MSILDEIKRDAARRDRFSPAARLVSDILDAAYQARRQGVSLAKIEAVLRDAADDFRDMRAN